MRMRGRVRVGVARGVHVMVEPSPGVHQPGWLVKAFTGARHRGRERAPHGEQHGEKQQKPDAQGLHGAKGITRGRSR